MKATVQDVIRIIREERDKMRRETQDKPEDVGPDLVELMEKA